MNRNSKNTNTSNVRFENTEEGMRILNSLSESLQQIRRENEHNGEAKILTSFSKKNKAKYYTTPFEKDLDNLIIRRKSKTLKNSNIILPHLQNQQSYIRINPPKN